MIRKTGEEYSKKEYLLKKKSVHALKGKNDRNMVISVGKRLKRRRPPVPFLLGPGNYETGRCGGRESALKGGRACRRCRGQCVQGREWKASLINGEEEESNRYTTLRLGGGGDNSQRRGRIVRCRFQERDLYEKRSQGIRVVARRGGGRLNTITDENGRNLLLNILAEG